ncbi:nectin-4-like isoform X2 [Pseudorasbora parva]|uniref:nectin-4-like isoform X2 n=1 Tax=Pseudorasbora parva TaxID=51549 RepID=UPI00351DBBEB
MKTVSYILAAMIFWNSACVSGENESFLEPSKTPWELQSLAEEETRLPCRFNVSNRHIQVVQVTWIRRSSNGAEEQIITAHFREGQTETPAYSGRVRFEANDPIANSALIILRTSSADEGKYVCKVATFPTGNFDIQILLTVWTRPITSLEPFVLVEGQSFRPAAACRSVAKPMAGLSWDTDLSGQSQNRSLDGMVASIQFSLHPLRSMNGQKLDCLVWHPSQNGPLRISNKLIVHYPPNALISGYEDNWHVDMQGATLQCNVEGNPKPDRFNWTRKGKALPEGVNVDGGTLRFSMPLRLTDQGDYVCTTTNVVGSGKAEISISIADTIMPVNYMMIIIIAGVAAAVVLTLIVIIISVNRHYKRKNQQLAMELNAKKEEISTLSRQASFRRVNSSSTARYSEDSHPLKVEGTLRTSLSSLDRPRSRDSRSTLGGVDSLGRPAIFNTSRRGRDKLMERSDRESTRMMMMESYEEDSNMSQETQLLPPLHPSSYSMEQPNEIIRSRNGNAILPAEGTPRSGGSSRAGSRGHHSPLVSMYPTLTDEEEEDSVSPADSGVHRGLTEHDGFENGSSETASSQISEALSNHFERANGTLRPKSKPNNILLPANAKLFLTPHSPTIHKAQIV